MFIYMYMCVYRLNIVRTSYEGKVELLGSAHKKSIHNTKEFKINVFRYVTKYKGKSFMTVQCSI
jgi:hypothetical protein